MQATLCITNFCNFVNYIAIVIIIIEYQCIACIFLSFCRLNYTKNVDRSFIAANELDTISANDRDILVLVFLSFYHKLEHRTHNLVYRVVDFPTSLMYWLRFRTSSWEIRSSTCSTSKARILFTYFLFLVISAFLFF